MKMKLHSLKIKDELQGRLSLTPQYLACSVLKENNMNSHSCGFDISERGRSSFLLDEDDSFKDALPDFLSVSDQSFYSQTHELICDMSSADLCKYYAGIGHADASNCDKDQVNGLVGEVFYEVSESNIPDFVAVTFITRSPGSPLYDGTDTQVETSLLYRKLYIG